MDFGQLRNRIRRLFNQFRRIVLHAVAWFAVEFLPNRLKLGIKWEVFAESLRFAFSPVFDIAGGKFDAAFVFVFLLQILGETFITFVGNHGQHIHALIAHAFAVLVHCQPQPAPDFLPFFNDRAGFVERANLEYIGIVPALFQCGMGKDKTQRAGERKQRFLIAHNQMIGVVVSLRIAFGVFEFAVFILRKIAVVHAV